MTTKGEAAGQLVSKALQELGESLAAGRSEALTEYLATLARFHTYSFGNVLLIMSQRPSATRVAGFRTWQSLGRQVRRGEKGIVIRAPIVLKENEEGERRIHFKAVHVFDIDQTDGKPLPELGRVGGDPGQTLATLKDHVANSRIEILYADDLGTALGCSEGGRITLKTGLGAAEEFAVLAHELAHEVLHQGEGERPPRKIRELEAEAVAFVVCTAAGLEARAAASDYIQLYQGDSETLSASLERIQKTASAIVEALHEPEAHALAA